ncbi:hypothetical protein R9X47_28785 [Wukongibacter baidiensis]|uniref:hypothetical protein n=1 Tax=Wukongibacter baidiensis TaxID=1723361 RepID=UPI003D7FA7C9
MQKKYLTILVFIIGLLAIVFTTRGDNDKYFPEVSYEILSYKEVPQSIKDTIDDRIQPNSNSIISILGSGESYIILTPPVNKSVEILSVEKNKNVVNDVIYRYKHVDKVSDNILDNIMIIKVSNFNGSFTSSRIND